MGIDWILVGSQGRPAKNAGTSKLRLISAPPEVRFFLDTLLHTTLPDDVFDKMCENLRKDKNTRVSTTSLLFYWWIKYYMFIVYIGYTQTDCDYG